MWLSLFTSILGQYCRPTLSMPPGTHQHQLLLFSCPCTSSQDLPDEENCGWVWTKTDVAKNKDSYHSDLLSILPTTWACVCLTMQACGIDHRQDTEDKRWGEVCLFMDLHIFLSQTQNRGIPSMLLTGMSLLSHGQTQC